MNYKWKTMQNTQATRQEHSWKLRLIGYPEVEYCSQLIRFLGKLGKRYRIVNSTTKQQWVIRPDNSPVYAIHRCEHIYDIRTGEVFAVNGDVLRILVYKD